MPQAVSCDTACGISFAPIGAGLVGLWTAIENIRQDFSGVWGTPQQAESG